MTMIHDHPFTCSLHHISARKDLPAYFCSIHPKMTGKVVVRRATDKPKSVRHQNRSSSQPFHSLYATGPAFQSLDSSLNLYQPLLQFSLLPASHDWEGSERGRYLQLTGLSP
jgi:hypothetical protein